MARTPLEMSPEELDVMYGKPKNLSAALTTVLSVTFNENHDRITVEAVTEKDERVSITLTQLALRDIVRLSGESSDAPTRPRAN